MKKNIISRLIIITLITFFGFISCSKEDDTRKDIRENAKISNYLKLFYKKEFSIGKSIESKVIKPSSIASKSIEYQDLIVTEVFIGEETIARGYILTNKETNVFLYFVDVDRVDYKMTKIDIETNEIQVINNIDQLNKYIETNKFDLIKVTQDIEQGIMASDADIAEVFATSSNAKIVAQFVHVWADGCIGTHTFHSALFGLFQWDTYERIVCPNGVTP